MTYLHEVSIELTCTGLHAVRPCMTGVTVAGTSAALVPSAAGSAATDSTRFPEGAALETRHHAPNGDDWRTDWCGGWCSDYEFSVGDWPT